MAWCIHVVDGVLKGVVVPGAELLLPALQANKSITWLNGADDLVARESFCKPTL